MHEQDERIVHRILHGEKRAFAELVRRHQDKAMTLAMRMLKNREEAEEAVQDAFVRVFQALEKFEWKSSFSTWMYRIVYNVCATALERKHPQRAVTMEETSWDEFEPADNALLPDAEYESEEFRRIVEEEIAKLPEPYGGTFTLFVIQDLGYDEIVAVTGLPIGTVKARLFRARAMLRVSVLRRLGHQPGGREDGRSDKRQKEMYI